MEDVNQDIVIPRPGDGECLLLSAESSLNWKEMVKSDLKSGHQAAAAI